jgi:hypothetical protein
LETLFEEPELTLRSTEPPAGAYSVVISSHDDGIRSFYVRSKDKSVEVRKFVLKINALADEMVPLRLEINDRAIDTLCLAQYDNRIYRARVVQVDGNLPKNFVNVLLLETGERLTLNVNKLFKMSEALKAVPPYAKQFKLESFQPLFGITKDQADFFFSYMTFNKVLSMVVTGSGDVPTCKLFADGIDVAERIRTWDPFTLEYPTQLTPEFNVTIPVMFMYGVTPEKFYVADRIKSEIMERKLVDMKNFSLPPLKNIEINSACLVKVENRFFRAKVIEQCFQNLYIVSLVDVGLEEEFSDCEIFASVEEITASPPLAIKCALKGYEDQLVSSDVVAGFRRALENIEEFNMTVVGTDDGSFIVKLVDSIGKSVYDVIEEARSLEDAHSNWTEDVTPTNIHFQNRANVKLNQTIHAEILADSTGKSNNWEDKTREYDGFLTVAVD